jgi:hypothetical protein
MDNCKISIYLAYSMAVYSIASMYYLIATKSVGTPFRDSLTKKQLKIKKKSKKVRFKIFQMGLILAMVVLFIIKPFNKCA